MMNLQIVHLAQAVTQALQNKAASSAPLSRPIIAEYAFIPQHDPAELKIPTVTVVPKSRETELASRAGLDCHFYIDLGIQYKTTGANGEVESLMALVAEIDTFLADASIEGVTWVGSANNPLYVPEHLRKGVFTSVLTLTYRGVG